MGKSSKKEDSEAVFGSDYFEEIRKFHEIADLLKQKYGLHNYDLIDMIMGKHNSSKKEGIPITAFSTRKLGCLEAAVKYMKENLGLSSGKISNMLNRHISTISSTYIKSKSKMRERIDDKEAQYFIPASEFCSRKFSALETVAMFLKSRGIANRKIAELLKKDPKTVWTVLSRAAKKEEKNG